MPCASKAASSAARGEALVFAGLQGSYGRDEARSESGVDGKCQALIRWSSELLG